MNRADLQHLAELRLKEAGVLLDASCFEGAYYLAGYAIECAIKACFARKTEQYDFPSIKAVNQVYSHDPTKLISAAGLEEELAKELKSNLSLNANWAVVKQWSEQQRYAANIAESNAKDLLSAIGDPVNGVFTWLKKLW
jgi:HEPN domain-containing protein